MEAKNISGKSVRQIARDLKLSHSVVSQVIGNKYTGSDETRQRVMEYIRLVEINKEDLNTIIYSEPDKFLKGMFIILKDKSINVSDMEFFTKLYYFVNNFKNNQNEIAKKTESEETDS